MSGSSVSSLNQPLRGDGKGRYRIHIVGNSGAGKSTLARELSAILNLPCILLDTIYWRPGWQEAPVDEFRTSVRAALDQDPRGWVVDGNYTSKLGDMVTGQATDVIWLDPPLVLYFPRLCWRTFLRLFWLAPQCSQGCEESLRKVFFSRDSIIWWCLTNHSVARKREGERYRVDGLHVGGKCRRLGGWGGELAAWKQAVREMVEREQMGSDS
ncbi:AAA domain-containing protein [Cerioporus squamosus]|nr:AAA domain-containing protein [Cerioporus squamosus]